MLPFLLAVAYILLSVAVAYVGRDTLTGFLGTLVLSLVLTPVLVLVAIVVFTKRRVAR